MKRTIAAIGAAVLVSVPAVPATAQASLCGTTVRGALTLQEDLDCDIYVGTGANIDLNGYAINGQVSVDRGVEGVAWDVEIRNGTVGSMYLIDSIVKLADLVVEGSIMLRATTLEADRVDTHFSQEDWQPGGNVTFRDGRIRGIGECYQCDNGIYRISGSQVDAISGINAHLWVTDSDIAGLDMDGSEWILDDGSTHFESYIVDLDGNQITGDVTLRHASSVRFASNQFEGAGALLSDGVGGIDIQGNRFRGNGWSGLAIEGSDGDPAGLPRGSVAGNRFVGNRGDGLSVSPATGSDIVVRDNVALRNEGYGMAVAGVVDGGGNVAQANGGPEQCVGVVCATK